MFTKKQLLIAITIIHLMGFSSLAASRVVVKPPLCKWMVVRTCPTDAVSITTGLPGVTNNTQCKAPAGVTSDPQLVQLTSIGTWGFIQDNKIWRYVSAIGKLEKVCAP